MDFQTYFGQVREAIIDTDVSSIEGKLAIQINITNEAEGTFYIEVKEGKLSVEPYEYIDRDVSITISSDNFTNLMKGKADPVVLYTMGKLKVDGDIGKALELKKFV